MGEKDKKSTIALDNPSKFSNDLWSEIVDNALFSRPKNDICDYLLYLFNKHDSAHFLDSNTNEQNERLLKMNASKIKSSKKNIAIKFMDEGEYSDIFKDFLKHFAENIKCKKIIIKGDKFYFTIENRALRDILESKLKAITLDTLDYSFNTEKVSVSVISFLDMLENEVPKDMQGEFKKLVAQLKRNYKFKKGAEILKAVAGFSADISSIISCVKL